MKKEYDYSPLRKRMKEHDYTVESMAKELNITTTTLSLKLNNKATFKQNEIEMMCHLLEIDSQDIAKWFFRELVM